QRRRCPTPSCGGTPRSAGRRSRRPALAAGLSSRPPRTGRHCLSLAAPTPQSLLEAAICHFPPARTTPPVNPLAPPVPPRPPPRPCRDASTLLVAASSGPRPALLR